MTDPIRIERGTPTAEELAALVGVLVVARSRGGATPKRPAGSWAVSYRPTIKLRAGADAWRRSARPR
jgi:hypothetical protein